MDTLKEPWKGGHGVIVAAAAVVVAARGAGAAPARETQAASKLETDSIYISGYQVDSGLGS